jgi:putative flippase GtrA
MLISRSFVLFIAVGALSAGINIGARIVFNLFVPFALAIILAFAVGLTTAFVLNKIIVFQSTGGSIATQYVRFALVNLVALFQVWIVSMSLARILFPSIGFSFHPDTIAHLIGVASPALTSYWAHREFSFSVARK